MFAEAGRQGSCLGRTRVTRYRGLEANSNPRVPLSLRGNVPFQSMISQTWVERTGNMMHVFPDPPEFTIFTLEIPDKDLNDADMGYWAEDENDNGAGPST